MNQNRVEMRKGLMFCLYSSLQIFCSRKHLCPRFLNKRRILEQQNRPVTVLVTTEEADNLKTLQI